MKKVLLSAVIALMAFCQIQAQISLTLTDMPQIGDVFYTATDTVPTVNEGSAGANQIWNLAGIVQHESDSMMYIDPALTPYGDEFPGALLCQLSSNNTYAYLGINASEVVVMGYVMPSPLSVNDTFFVHLDKTIMILPNDYLDELFDTTSFSLTTYYGQTINYQGFPVTVDSIRMKTTIFAHQITDAYGSVTTPLTSFADVLRSYNYEIQKDSVWGYIGSFNMWLPYTNSTDTNETYEWWGKDIGNSIATVEYNNGLIDKATYMTTPTTSINKVSDNNINVYPNPTADHVSISKGSNVTMFTVTDAQGNTIIDSPVINNRISLQGLSSGVYFYKACDVNGKIVKSGKFIKN